MSEGSESSRLFNPAVSIMLLIMVLLAIPLVMEWQKLDEDDVRTIGRVCGGIAVALCIYGVISRALRLLLLLAGAAITLTILVTEGVIDLPKF